MDFEISALMHEVIWIFLAAWQVTNLSVIAIQLRRHRKECHQQNAERVNELTKLRHALVQTGTRLQDVIQPAVHAHMDAVTRTSALSADNSNRSGSIVPIRGQRPPVAVKPVAHGPPDSEPPSGPAA